MNEPVTEEREQLAAVQQALEALENYQRFIEDAHILEGQWHWIDGADKAITALQSIIEQQPAPWVGLTDEERKEIWKGCDPQHAGYVTALVEAKLKEKNERKEKNT